jgi:hypothetical protein
MNRIVIAFLSVLLFGMYGCTSNNNSNNKTISKTNELKSSTSEYFKGNWTYRSLHNFPIDTPFCDLEFATAVMRFERIDKDSIFGILDMGDGYALNLKGKVKTCDDATTFYIEGPGVPGTNTDGWEYDYQGYVVPKWGKGVNQVDACVGSVLRAKPHDQSKAGKTASFYMVRQ